MPAFYLASMLREARLARLSPLPNAMAAVPSVADENDQSDDGGRVAARPDHSQPVAPESGGNASTDEIRGESERRIPDQGPEVETADDLRERARARESGLPTEWAIWITLPFGMASNSLSAAD